MNEPSISIPIPIPIPSRDSDIATNPLGFNRDAFLKQLAVDITAFFDKTLL